MTSDLDRRWGIESARGKHRWEILSPSSESMNFFRARGCRCREYATWDSVSIYPSDLESIHAPDVQRDAGRLTIDRTVTEENGRFRTWWARCRRCDRPWKIRFENQDRAVHYWWTERDEDPVTAAIQTMTGLFGMNFIREDHDGDPNERWTWHSDW